MDNHINYEKRPLLEHQAPPAEAEPSLAELQSDVFKAQRRYIRAWSRTTSGKWHRCLMLSVSLLILAFVASAVVVLALDDTITDEWPRARVEKVALEAHIMSKCPDARDCLHDLVLPTMQNVSHMVDFRLSYIGRMADDDGGVECKHGPGECLGNIIELCAAKLYPVKQSLGFTMCLSRDYENIPEKDLIDDCALEHGITTASLGNCAAEEDGGLAGDMLRASFARTAAANVTKSCTVRVDEEIWCIRDDGEWKDCDNGSSPEDLIANITKRFRHSWD